MHGAFVLIVIALAAIRSYWTGFADASGDRVTHAGEGRLVLFLRYFLGTPYVIAMALLVCCPDTLKMFSIGLPNWVKIAGLVLMISGAYLYHLVHRFLNKNFTDTVFIRREAFLVTTGPYRYVRHPMYDAFLIIAVGVLLSTGNLLAGGFGILLCLMVMWVRLPIEEKALKEAFGQRWVDYAAKTPRFIPSFKFI